MKMKIEDFLKKEMNFTDRDLEYKPSINYCKVLELIEKYHNEQLRLLSVGKSLKEKEEKPSAKYTNDIDKNYW